MRPRIVGRLIPNLAIKSARCVHKRNLRQEMSRYFNLLMLIL